MLRPIVEAAGYLVIGEGDELQRRPRHRVRRRADRGRRATAARAALATDPDAADGNDSIYRYDRAGLLIALEVRRRGEGLMNELLLIVTIAGSRVAFPAARSKAWSSSTR